MANSKEPCSFKSMTHNGKNSLLPPKSPFPSISPSYAEYIPISAIAPKALPKPRDGNFHHLRTSSESFLLEEQPSWLDELLNEPETPVRRGGHRRASSDSFAYTDITNAGSMNYVAQDDNKFKNSTPVSAWGSQDFDIYRDMRKNSFYGQLNPSCRTRNKPWDAPVSSFELTRGLTTPRGNNIVPSGGSFSTLQDTDRNPPTSTEKQDMVDYSLSDPKGYIEKKLETDTKRAKQQFAQRSRVRKLQYIAELERNVQALQAEGSGVSAELEFLNQQNLILSMENKALKQRLESLAQEQLLKYLEHEVLEKELGRLKSLYQQQQQQPSQQRQMSSNHRRANSRDLDQQLAALSLKPKDAGQLSYLQ